MPRWRRSRRLRTGCAEWLPKIRSREYDSRFLPFWEKTAVTLGMGMTEKQGGTDVRANTTRAEPRAGDEYALTGHKWFMSAPMCDAFLVLAQAPGRPDLLPRSALPAGGHIERAAPAAAQGQARQPLQRLLRGRVRGCLRLEDRRGRARGAHHHRDGAADPARLRRRFRRADPDGAGARGASCPSPQRRSRRS